MSSKISQLEEVVELTGEEVSVIVVGNGNYKFKLSAIKQLITKSDVQLDNVDNTSDANKPVSEATQVALNLKADAAGLEALVDGKIEDASVNNVVCEVRQW